MTFEAFENALLALCAWREASGEGRTGMQAVMNVIRNRVRAGWGDLATVIEKRNQFSSISVPGDAATVRWPLAGDESFTTALQLAAAIDTTADITNGALYYWNPATATSAWFKDNIADRCPKVAVIGHHEFFGAVPKEAHA